MAKSIHKRSNNTRKAIAIIIAIAFLAFISCKVYTGMEGSNEADRVMKQLETIIPDLGAEKGTESGLGRDPLAAVSIDGIDIVGVLEIPSLNIKAPVTGKNASQEYFGTWVDGSPVQGQFMVKGGHDDLFRKISTLKPGDRVVFTDIDGVRYSYTVITQYHLKRWDIGDNDLLLCCESDSDTYFVVGCDTE